MFVTKLIRSSAPLLLLAALACGDDDGNAPPPPTGGITVAVDSASRTVAPGGTATIGVTITRTTPFAGPVALSVESAQAGITGTFAPDTIGASATTSTLTVTAGPTVAAGAYPITIRAKGAGITDQTATATINVTANPTIALSLTPDAVSIQQGATGNSLVRVTRGGGFAGAVTLTVAGLPDSVTATIGSQSLTGDTTTIAFAAAGNVAPGAYAAVVTGAATGVTPVSDTVTVTVTPRPGFALAVSPDSLSVTQGQSGSATVRVTRGNGFTAAVLLALDSLPSGITAVLAEDSLTTDSTTLVVNAAASVAAGVYPIVVRGASAGVTSRSDTLRLTVTVPPVGITISATPDSIITAAGHDTSFTVVIARNNFSDTVSVSVAGTPAGVGAISSSTVGDTVRVTLAVGDSAVLGTYTLVVSGSGNGIATARDSVRLVVIAPPSPRVGGSRAITPSSVKRSGRSTSAVTPRVDASPALRATRLAIQPAPLDRRGVRLT